MADFRVIDADSHVEEPMDAWAHLDPRYEARRPFPIKGENRPFLHNMNAFWYIDGGVYPKVTGQGVTILDRFPAMRVAFLEAGVDWVPYLIQRMDHYYHSETANGRPTPKRRASDYIRDCQVYFTCEAEEKLVPQVMEFVGENRLMISADMPHGEAREGSVEEIRQRTDLADAVKQKILGDNAAEFYQL